jgi:hypothetical protein
MRQSNFYKKQTGEKFSSIFRQSALAECRRPLREKFQVRSEADRVRRFLLWAKETKVVDAAADETVR